MVAALKGVKPFAQRVHPFHVHMNPATQWQSRLLEAVSCWIAFDSMMRAPRDSA